MKHTFTEQSKHIFCIHGNLEDMICPSNLRKEKFNEFLSEYLRHKMGFETVVFYLAARGMRVYDQESAKLLTENVPVNEEADSAGQDHDFIYDEDDDFDESEFAWENELYPESGADPKSASNSGNGTNLKTASNPGNGTNPKRDFDPGNDEDDIEGREYTGSAVLTEKALPASRTEKKTVYTARIETTDFIAMLDARLKDPNHKIAFVFESIADYIRVNSEYDSQFSATLHYLLTDSLDDNQNRVIFLAMNKDLQQIYAEAANDDILRGVLFQEINGRLEYNREAILSFERPGQDEIANLLEHYRIYGSEKAGVRKFLAYPVHELNDMAYLIEQYMTVSGENTLSSLNGFLTEWMHSRKGTKISFDEAAIQQMFPKVLPRYLPWQRLKELDHAEDIYHRAMILKKHAELADHTGSPYDLIRFTRSERSGIDTAKRFLISGIERSNRTEAALVLADFLYYVGEVTENVPTVIRGAALRQLAAENVSAAVKSWFAAAKNGVLVVDDMETLLSCPEHEQILTAFHQAFLHELEHNRMQHFIFVINLSKVEAVFGSYRKAYDIPEQNYLVTKKQVPVPEERYTAARGDTER